MNVYQSLRPKDVRELKERLGITSRTLSVLFDLSEPALSLFLSNQRGLSYRAQSRALLAMRFIRELAEDNAAPPVDFAQTERIVELFNRYRNLYDESCVLKLASELEEATP